MVREGTVMVREGTVMVREGTVMVREGTVMVREQHKGLTISRGLLSMLPSISLCKITLVALWAPFLRWTAMLKVTMSPANMVNVPL